MMASKEMLHGLSHSTSVQVRLASSFQFGVGAEPGRVVSGSLPSRAGINTQRNGMERKNTMSVRKCIKQGGGKVEGWR